MPSKAGGIPVYDIRVDRGLLKRESLGPLFVRLTVGLIPTTLDANWRRSYEVISNESDRFDRFTLDAEKAVVLMTCRSSESAAEIQTLMQRLDLLLELTNLRATVVATSRQSDTA